MSRNTQLDVTRAAKIIAEYSYGSKGMWAYECFDYLNAAYFAGELPTPHIIWEPTKYGHCLGKTFSNSIPMPTIKLHPAIIGHNSTSKPWGVDDRFLGVRYAFDVLMHELVHVHVFYVCRHINKLKTNDSHNNKFWVEKCEEISRQLGYDVQLYNGKTRRVNGGVARANPAGYLPYECCYRWPMAMRRYLGEQDYYLSDELECNIQLGVT